MLSVTTDRENVGYEPPGSQAFPGVPTLPNTPQAIPFGIERIGALRSKSARIDGVDQRVDADIAVLDGGIKPNIDLNVAGGFNCTSRRTGEWADQDGHGTHVAGTAAAIDNAVGVVGVAPGLGSGPCG